MKRVLLVLSALLLAASFIAGQGKIKIGFLVKQPEEPWFQNEWKFADEAAAADGFEVIKIGTTDGEKVLSAIDNIAAQQAKGFIICTPDVKLGPSIVAKAKALNLKVMSVDDRFIGADGQPLESVPHMGISATKIGELVGQALWDEMQKRGWKSGDTGAIAISYYELQTAKDRNEGAISALTKAGFPAARIFDSPQKFPLDVESGLNAAQTTLTKNPKIKHWLIFGLNDETVLGGVRATENRGFKAADVIGVGIGGQGTADTEFKKANATGFFATVTISPKRHGYETSELMYRWIKDGVAPPAITLTAGTLMTRDNMQQVFKDLGLSE